MHKNLQYWLSNYAREEVGDQRAINDFVTVETREAISSFRNELVGISQGNYDEDTLLILLKENRLNKFSSYANWASRMLQWMAMALK